MFAVWFAILVEELGVGSFQRPSKLGAVSLAGVDLVALGMDSKEKWFVGGRLELLGDVLSHDGSGVLSRATTILRINTKRGKAPASGCNAAHAGQEVRRPYSADYLFCATK